MSTEAERAAVRPYNQVAILRFLMPRTCKVCSALALDVDQGHYVCRACELIGNVGTMLSIDEVESGHIAGVRHKGCPLESPAVEGEKVRVARMPPTCVLCGYHRIQSFGYWDDHVYWCECVEPPRIIPSTVFPKNRAEWCPLEEGA